MARPLPLRWGHETELTVSAVQAFDPYLKWGRAVPYCSGYLPQPVVRTTARRTADGHLADGFLTSFVNTSRVEPINTVDDVAVIFDQWLTVLSRLGLNARHIRLHGDLAIWRRREVQGVTLRFSHAGLSLGDLVVLQPVDQPERLVVDLGTGLERLGWAISRLPWTTVVHGRPTTLLAGEQLDTLRTATLLLASGVHPAARGAGSVTHRSLRRLLHLSAQTGHLQNLRSSAQSIYAYWAQTTNLRLPWAAVEDSLVRTLDL
ncbi:hypothetical protein [Myceligenerans salitolerans]|uniref:Uncharacterized protein n=1 Tax=Myceligenerans salitolerans TaxID=1230528 RepID=A0ABS3ICE5_9MICO|nr:hypothetical protein [Myceligenerans salitolerans]MBO0610702.1 hypothetical protein [Myceligenerans salitolerans]